MQYSMRLVGVLALCDVLMEIGIATDHSYSIMAGYGWADDGHFLCIVFSVFFYIGFTSTWLWITCIAINLAFIIFQPIRPKPRRLPIHYFAIATFATAAICAVILGSTGGFGVTKTADTQWCLIRNSQSELYIIFALVPSTVIWLSICGIYASIIWRLYFTFFTDKRLPEGSKTSYLNVIQKSAVYPLIFMCIWLPACIWAIWFIIGGETRAVAFFTITSVNLSGIFNTFGYVIVGRLIDRFSKNKRSGDSSTKSTSRTNMNFSKSIPNTSIAGSVYDLSIYQNGTEVENDHIPPNEIPTDGGDDDEDNNDDEDDGQEYNDNTNENNETSDQSRAS
eukprot:TRINITY_DN4793_c0_g4_i1.p1 TRINITY_DN4793_c0_g4~~TRINITY_DN4793_c0_g4_i1.p1  ORF type:complete len:336 (+),score=50.68 TRINITY_DN4793_c0_g4_i1:258-1265(+)